MRQISNPGNLLLLQHALDTLDVAWSEGTAYYVASPYPRAVKVFRAAAEKAGLLIPLQIDVARQLRQNLRIGLKPGTILGIYCPYLLLQAAVWDGSGAGLIPVRAGISPEGPGSMIRLAGPYPSDLPLALRSAGDRFLARLSDLLEKDRRAKNGSRTLARLRIHWTGVEWTHARAWRAGAVAATAIRQDRRNSSDKVYLRWRHHPSHFRRPLIKEIAAPRSRPKRLLSPVVGYSTVTVESRARLSRP